MFALDSVLVMSKVKRCEKRRKTIDFFYQRERTHDHADRSVKFDDFIIKFSKAERQTEVKLINIVQYLNKSCFFSVAERRKCDVSMMRRYKGKEKRKKKEKVQGALRRRRRRI